jgi:ATP-dependent protease ClpP protease subunit
MKFLKLASLAIVLLAGAVLVRNAVTPEPLKSGFTHAQVVKIDPVAVIDRYTLLHKDAASGFVQDLMQNLAKKGVVSIHPLFGAFVNEDKVGQPINIIIQSWGGDVSLGRGIHSVLFGLRKAGVFINCYVSEAQSMAFYIMLTTCDNVIATRNVVLMQHRVHYNGNGHSPATYLTDVEMAREEAASLNYDLHKWLLLTRGSENDHVFSKKEYESMGIINSYVEF